MPHDGDNRLANTARILNMAGPPCCSVSCRMSGVLGQKLGRMWSAEATSSWQYSRISRALVRQVKYVYDWEKPIVARPCMTAGRVKASARNSTSGSASLTVQMSQCQKFIGLVCGLST